MSELLDIKKNNLKYIKNKINNDDIISLNNIELKNLNINNTFEISYSNDVKKINQPNNSSIKLLDRIDSIFKDIYMKDNDLYIIPKDVSINNTIEIKNHTKLVRTDELNTIINSDVEPFIFDDIKIEDGKTIRFIKRNDDGILDENSLNNTLIGFRQNNGRIEFRNQYYNEWIPLAQSTGTFSFYELSNVQFQKPDADIGDYIILDNNKKLINTSLNIIDDTTPQLGGNLFINNNNIVFDTEGGILDNTGNISLKISNNIINSNNSYLEILKNKNTNDEDIIELKAKNTISEYGNFKISTDGGGDLEIDLIENDNTKGDVIIKANEFNLSDVESFNMSTGKFISSLHFIYLSDETAGTIESESKLININSETIILQNDYQKTYYIYINSGINGQKINLIYESKVDNSNVIVLFKDGNTTKYVGTGGGLGNKLIFNQSGQSACLQYIEFYNSEPNLHRNRWQILNTGCQIK